MNQQQKELLQQKIKEMTEALQKKTTTQLDSGFWSPLQTDEALLIQLMTAPPYGNSPYPTPDTPGNLEWSWCLYFLNVELQNQYGVLGGSLYKLLKDVFGMPDTQITAADWTNWWAIWEGGGVLMGDGSLVATQYYAVMDPAWSLAMFDYFMQYVKIHSIAPFVTSPNKITIDPASQPTLTIAVMGDWGTGAYTDGSSATSPSAQVMAQIANLSPDIVVHLGDVYYAGTDNGLLDGEEQNNLVNAWTYNAPLGNFTLNSNHEMYSGAKGYYNVALNNAVTSLFSQQNGTSYFSITYGDWVILGLDTAYNATGMYMQGRITDSYQPSFIQQQATGKKTILLTHHNPIDLLGQSTNPLWTDVTGSSALNGSPDIWYWGHIHNGIVYTNKAATGNTLARCLGNAAIPIGTANWLLQEEQQSNPTVSFFTNTPLKDGTKNNALRVKNGFAIIQITNGVVTETWYDQSGAQYWSNANA